MAYPTRRRQMQDAAMRDIRWAGRTGLCPVCRVRPSATWADGARRITCGAIDCYMRWLPVRYPPTTTGEKTDQ